MGLVGYEKFVFSAPNPNKKAMLMSLNDWRVARSIILIIKSPVGHGEGVCCELTVLILRACWSWSACLLGLVCLVGTLLCLDAVAILELLLMNRLAHLKHVDDGLE